MKILFQSDKLESVNIDKQIERKDLLCKNSKFKVVSFNFKKGEGLPDHVHEGYASIMVYKGKIDMKFETGERFELNEGEFLYFDAQVKHNVIAEIQSRVLVTISESI